MAVKKLKWIFGAAGLVTAGIAIFHVFSSEAEMPRPIVTVTAHLTEHASEFFADNPHIDSLPHIKSEASGEYYADTNLIAFVAHASRADEPDGYVLRYQDGDCEVTLPAGRAVAFDYQAGFFTLLTSTLPLEPLSFDEVMALAKDIGASFEQAGWERTKYKDNITQERFGEYTLGGKLEILGEWVPCNDPLFYTAILIKSFNSLPSGPSIPPVPGRPLPDDYPDRYIIQVDMGTKGLAFDNEVTALRDARRVAVHGDKSEALTLKDWLDDPDWRPEGWRGKHIE